MFSGPQISGPSVFARQSRSVIISFSLNLLGKVEDLDIELRLYIPFVSTSFSCGSQLVFCYKRYVILSFKEKKIIIQDNCTICHVTHQSSQWIRKTELSTSFLSNNISGTHIDAPK